MVRSPLAKVIRGQIQTMVAEGTYPPGSQLPSEQEMARLLQVSRSTIREAYRDLAESGVLLRRQGLGTYVKGIQDRHSLESTLSYTKMIEDAGHRPGVRVLSEQTRLAQPSEIEQLRLDPGDLVWEVIRLRTADERPIIYSADRIPAEFVPVSLRNRRVQSLFGLLADLGYEPSSGRAQLRPVLADAAVARPLEVEVGVPLLFFEETDTRTDGTPVMISSEWHVTDVLEFWLTRRADN
ncbi:MAG: GntR family transcriptional regulator [Beutenbergiaceae bacterium]